jgi:hypothetical protein
LAIDFFPLGPRRFDSAWFRPATSGNETARRLELLTRYASFNTSHPTQISTRDEFGADIFAFRPEWVT